MRNFRKWLIRKLGGFVVDGQSDYQSDYWRRENVSGTLYVPVEHYNEKGKDAIEHELAVKIGEELLKRDLLFMTRYRVDNGDVPVNCSVNVLKLKERAPYHMPSHLVFEKGDERMNEQNRTE